jgi:hypothetical protein
MLDTPWNPLSLAELSALLSGADFPWWLAGSLAIEAFVGRPLREHGDIDVLVFRRDQQAMRRLLRGWDCRMAGEGRFQPWNEGEDVPPGVHDLWCRRTAGEHWNLQVMLDEAEGATWRSRRDRRITRSIVDLGKDHVLAPEILLYYKAKNPSPKDEVDFRAAVPLLSPAQRTWLQEALGTAYGPHPWLASMTR